MRNINHMVVALFFLVLTHPASATPIMGGTGATEASPWGAAINPANAAMMTHSEIQMTPTLIENKELLVRYKGHPTNARSESGLGEMTTFMPRGVIKWGNFGFALTEILPTASIEMALQDIPLVLFGQPQPVDINVLAESKGGAAGSISYQFSKMFSIGLGGSFRSISVLGSISESSVSGELASLRLEDQESAVTGGLRLNLMGGRLALGLSANLMHQHTRTAEISSSLLENIDVDGPMATQQTLGSSFDKVNGGVSFDVMGKGRLAADFEYRKVTPTNEFSLVDFSEKPKDSYSSVAVRFGGILGGPLGYQYMAGGSYQPGSIGPGSRNADTDGAGKAGFGFTELTSIMGGLEPLKPFWTASAGVRANFGENLYKSGKKPSKKRKRRRRRKVKPIAKAWSVAAGIIYQKGSLGIDEDGEQPGAYQQTKIGIPVELSWRF